VGWGPKWAAKPLVIDEKHQKFKTVTGPCCDRITMVAHCIVKATG